jgi:hypothetical protein
MSFRFLSRLLLSLFALFCLLVGAWAWLNFGPLPQPSPSRYHQSGRFEPLQSWPLMPIHAVVLTDGRVMSYGTDSQGQQGATLVYDVWDPSKGFGADSHLTLPNTVGTDLFCVGQVVLARPDGRVLLAGGDLTENGVRNGASEDVNYFNPQKDTLEPLPYKMAKPRWYPILVTLPSADVLVAGGRTRGRGYTGEVEIHHADGTWGTLPKAYSEEAFGGSNWIYPRIWPVKDDKLVVLSITGAAFSMDMRNGGQISKQAVKGVPLGTSSAYLPSVMYRPGKIVSFRHGGKAVEVDISDGTPVVKNLSGYFPMRTMSTMVTMANGDVFLSGGSLRDNSNSYFVHSNRQTKIWHPESDTWTNGPLSQKMRLYHSIAMLMPDATVLTGGGGAPGPQDNLNVEVYEPPYLFKKDGSGELAPRPAITAAPAVAALGQVIKLAVKDAGAPLQRMTLVRASSVTHSIGFDQRFTDLKWSPDGGGNVTVQLPTQPHDAPPGYYFLFAIDQEGVPSVAKTLLLNRP